MSHAGREPSQPTPALDYEGEATRVLNTRCAHSKYEACDTCVAAALRRAHAAGLREAEALVRPPERNLFGGSYVSGIAIPRALREKADAIARRAEEVERA